MPSKALTDLLLLSNLSRETLRHYLAFDELTQSVPDNQVSPDMFKVKKSKDWHVTSAILIENSKTCMPLLWPAAVVKRSPIC